MRLKFAIGIGSAGIVSAVARKFTAMLRDRSGHVAMIFGIATIPLFVSVGVAVDMAQQSRVHLKLAGTADAIALAAARSYKDVDTRDAVGNRYLDANLEADYGPGVKVKNLKVNFDDEARLVTVNLIADVPTIMMGIAGIHKTTADIKSVVSYEGHVSEPVSLGLVLDVSGSMGKGSPARIKTLKKAGKRMLRRLRDADPDNVYVRTGLASYNHAIKNIEDMAWGVNRTLGEVNNLKHGGYTSSTDAVNMVGGWLIGNTEQLAHETQDVHGDRDFNLNRFMIFMTDGENKTNPEHDPDGTGAEQDDVATRARCDEIKADGVELYTVAFQAPVRGQELLEYCATSENHYFDATDEDAFLEAFDEIGDRIENTLIRIVD